MNQYSVKIIRDIDSFCQIEKDWNYLYDRGSYSKFQLFSYNYNCIKSQSLFTLLLIDSHNRILEIWPCVLNKGSLVFIDSIHSDFCDIISEYNGDFMLKFIMNNFEIKNILFQNIKSHSKVYKLLNNFNNSITYSTINYSVLSVSHTNNFPANFTHFVYRQRRRLNRIIKKHEHECSMLIVNDVDTFDTYLEDVKYLVKSMIDRGIRSPDFLPEYSLMRELIKKNNLYMSILKYNEEIANSIKKNICAISFYFKEDNDVSFWIDLYDNLSMINIYHNTLLIKTFTEDNNKRSNEIVKFNFGRGDYQYKIQNFGPDIFPLYNISIYKNKFSFILNKIYIYLYIFVKGLYKILKR